MHSIYLLAVLGVASLSHAWLFAARTAATEASSVRKLIPRSGTLQARFPTPYFRCGHDIVWPATPTDDAILFGVLNTTNLGAAQGQLMAVCDKGTPIPVSGNSEGEIHPVGDVYVQYCNIGTEPLPCKSDEVKQVFEQIRCGPQDAPQMGMGFHTLDDNGVIPGDQPTWGIVMGPNGSQKPCHAG